MTCVVLLGQAPLPDPHSYSAIGWAVAVLGVLGGFYLMSLRIGNERAKKIQNESGQPEKRTVLPSPLDVRKVDTDYVTQSQMKEAMTKIERDVDKRFDLQNEYLKAKFHKIDNDLGGIKLEGRERGEEAAEQLGGVAKTLNETCVTVAGVREKTESNERLLIQLNQTVMRAIEREIPPKKPA